jgi:hypothetical protein
VPNYVSTNGLVGYWPFSGNANDQSVNLNNGSVSGAILSSDRFGNPNSAYNFNGTSDYISVPDNSTLSGFNDMSISVWIKMNQFSGIQTFVSKWFYVLNCGSNSDNYALAIINNSITSATNNNNTTAFSSPQNLVTSDLNVWKHIVFVSNATQGQFIYINGVLTGSTVVPGAICNSTNPLIFGAAIPTFRFFDGGLDDIGIWNRALTPCEISRLYTSSLSPTLNVITSSSLICVGSSATLTANGAATSYSWNTNALTSAIVISPTVTTTYTVAGTNTLTGCSQSTTIVQNVELCNGIETLDLNNSIGIYPNPVSDNLYIRFNTSSQNEFIVCIEDLTGKQLLQQTFTGEQMNHQLKTTMLDNGIYFLKVSDSAGNVIKTQKIIVSGD